MLWPNILIYIYFFLNDERIPGISLPDMATYVTRMHYHGTGSGFFMSSSICHFGLSQMTLRGKCMDGSTNTRDILRSCYII